MAKSNKLELDLEIIKANEGDKNKENRAFREYLLKEDAAEIEKLITPIIEDVKSQIDCQKCGNCCTTRIINISRKEADTIAKHLGQDSNKFWKENITGFDGDPVLNKKPCRFLDDTKCTLGNLKPEDCITYPLLSKGKFAMCMYSPILSYPICPITYNVIEGIKIVTGFKGQ